MDKIQHVPLRGLSCARAAAARSRFRDDARAQHLPRTSRARARTPPPLDKARARQACAPMGTLHSIVVTVNAHKRRRTWYIVDPDPAVSRAVRGGGARSHAGLQGARRRRGDAPRRAARLRSRRQRAGRRADAARVQSRISTCRPADRGASHAMRHESAEIAGSRDPHRVHARPRLRSLRPRRFHLHHPRRALAAAARAGRVARRRARTSTGASKIEPAFRQSAVAAARVRRVRSHVRYVGTVEVEHYMAEPAHVVAGADRRAAASRRCRSCGRAAIARPTRCSSSRGANSATCRRATRRRTPCADGCARRSSFASARRRCATSALETLEQGAGVCRDFVHVDDRDAAQPQLPGALRHAASTTAPPEALGPPDFHSYVEAYIGDRWWLFDPTGITPLTGLIRIGTGRDAADVAFATMFGNVRGGMPKVAFAAVDDPGAGVALPQPTPPRRLHRRRC